MKKIYLFVNKSRSGKEVKKWFDKKSLGKEALLTDKPAQADLFMVAGGDGTLLHAIRLFVKFNKPFFGINRGTSGFLLNQIGSDEELAKVLKKFSSCKLIKLRLLKGKFFSGRRGRRKSSYAFNDFYVKASRGNERVVGAIRGAKSFPKHIFDGDGIIIATPQGSTAYNYSAGGAILSLGAKQLAIKSICARTALRAVVPEQKLTAEISRGRATAYADHSRISSQVKKFIVSPSAKFATLAFKPGYDFEFKRWHV